MTTTRAEIITRELEKVREMHAHMVLEAKFYGKDWVTKSEYLAKLKREHHKLYEATMRLLAADEALEGRSGPGVPEAVIPLGWLPPGANMRTLSRRWRRKTLSRPYP